MTQPQGHSGPRDPSLDALRAAAMLLGVLLHSIIPYMVEPVPHLLWPVRAPASEAFDAAYWWIHGFRVQLFFLIAGIFAFQSIRKLGAGGFVEHRLRRLGVPLLAAQVFVVGALMYPIWGVGWVLQGLAQPKHLIHVRFGHGMQQDLFGFAHLWFIAYLLIYSMGLAAILVRTRGDLSTSVGSDRGWAPWLLAIFAASTTVWLGLDPRCLTEFHNWFIPRASELVYHGLFFAAGVLIGARPKTLITIRRWWWVTLGLAQAVFPFFLSSARAWEGAGDWPAAAFAACYGWLSAMGWLGLAGSVFTRSGTSALYVSRRAYWLYVIHPPLVGLFQLMASALAWPAAVSALVVFAGATSIGLLLCDPCTAVLKRIEARLMGSPTASAKR